MLAKGTVTPLIVPIDIARADASDNVPKDKRARSVLMSLFGACLVVSHLQE